MSFFIAGCALLLALLVGTVFDDLGGGQRRTSMRAVSSLDPW